MLENWPILSGSILFLYFSSVCGDGSSGLQQSSDVVHDSNVSKREVSGLFPFPRIGRSGGDPDSESKPAMFLRVSKRQGLIPFPRVGKRHRGLMAFPRVGRSSDESIARSRIHPRPTPSMLASEDAIGNLDEAFFERGLLGSTAAVKRSLGQGGSGGLWFGPRLGRQKRSDSRDEAAAPYGRRVESLGPSWQSQGQDCDTIIHRHDLRSALRGAESQQPPNIAEENDDFEGEDVNDEYHELDTYADKGSEYLEYEDAGTIRGGQRQRRQLEDQNTKTAAASFLKEEEHHEKQWKVPEELVDASGSPVDIFHFRH